MKRLGNVGSSSKNACRGQGMSVLCLCAVAAAMGFGCNDSGNSNNDPTVTPGSGDQIVFSTYVEHDPVERSFDMESKAGCALDSDCADGRFCYHGVCTYQCNESTPCKEGTCSKSGRCIVENQKSLRDNKDDANSNVVFHIPGAVVLVAPPINTSVDKGATEAYVTLTAAKDYGRIDYNVQNPLENTESELRTSEPKTDDNGSVIYSFKLDADKSAKGDDGEVERLILDTAVGSFEIALVPRKPTTGFYEGSVKATQFAGVALPIRFAIETKPEIVKDFNQIEQITLFVPSSGADLFSPEIVEDASKTTWSKFEMKQTSGADCMNLDKCWKATFTVNNYTFPESELLSADQKVNRSIRIEINGFDESNMMFDGSMRDIMAGVYREAESDNKDKKQWAKAEMDGTFVVMRKTALNPDDYANATDRTDEKVKEETRDLSADGAIACTDDDIKKLMETLEGDCSSIATLKGYEDAENKQTCLLAAAANLLASKDLVSKTIEELITNPSNQQTGYTDLKDFLTECAKEVGPCEEKPEFTCAVDLLAHSYLTTTAADKAEILENWHKLLRESYLGRQYSAWQHDVEVRRKWLLNTGEPTFAAQELAKINNDMLAEWEKDVFAAHRHVLAKQFNQNSLEVLTLIDYDEAVRNKRDLILSEFADGWSAVSDTMSLGLRRYDALLQDTDQRLAKAQNMRPYLFDLYYAGLIETAINRTAGNGSLNAVYGKNLYEAVSHLRSLGQSFDDLVFMRDAKVETSSSLDSTKNNVLAERKELAKETLAAAEKKRKDVFDDYDQKNIDQAKINNTLSTTIDSLRTELVNICGLPRGCDDPKADNCAPRTVPGFCGFDLPFDSETPADINRDIDASVLAQPEISEAMKNYYKSKAYNISTDQMTMLTEDDIWDMNDSERITLLGIQSEELKVPEEMLIDEHGEAITDQDKIAEITKNYIESVVEPRITAYLANQQAVKTYLSTDLYSLTNNSEAANAVVAYRAALKDVDIAQADFNALYNKVAIARSTCDAYAANIEEWNDKRLELLEKIQQNVEKINEHYDNITQAERDKIAADIQLAKDQYSQQAIYISNWKEISASYKNHQKDRIKTIGAFTDASMSLEYAAAQTDRITNAIAEGIEKDLPGMKSIPLGIGAGINAVVEGAKLLCDATINHMDIDMQLADYDYNYKVELKGLMNDLSLQKLEKDLQLELSRYQKMPNQDSCEKNRLEMLRQEDNECLKTNSCTSVCKEVVTCDCSKSTEPITDIYSEVSCPVDKGCELKSEWYLMGLDQWILSEQNAIDTLDEVNDTMRELFDIQDAYNRDLQDLDFRRSEYMQMSQDLVTKRVQILKAQLNAYSALKNYFTIVQRAQMLQSQYDAATERLKGINALYTTPASVFAFASDLETVESKIELAKERIYDYLSVVEYEAVRPFVDLRRATYLARSTNDLGAIVDQVDTVVSKCGAGEPNYTTVEISAREMMGITQDFAGMTAGKRFQNVIAKGNIPINSLTRYTVESSVRDLVNSGVDRLRSGTFAVTIKQSMNLATTCNAKIDSIAIQIVGGEGVIREGAGENIHPTITVFYDGQSQLASCQPNIESLVQTIGPKTAYGVYSSFVVKPQKISAIAGINEYGDPNNTLKGKPFATSYTVLIDTQISENPKIDWDKVEDIKLRVRYSYNDVMQESACENL